MLSFLLAKKIFELFLYMVIGFVLVKAKMLDSKDSVVLSKVCSSLLCSRFRSKKGRIEFYCN